MRRNNRIFCSGFTLVELMLAVLISSIVVLVVGVVVVAGVHNWVQTYNAANEQTMEDATDVAVAFGSIGRMSNRFNNAIPSQAQGYMFYTYNGSTFTPVPAPTGNGDTVVWGDAVEFRYWNVSLDTNDTYGLMNPAIIATTYALFYIDSNQLKVDYGPYPPGAVPAGGGRRNTLNVNTVVLANNVSTNPTLGLKAFSYTARGGIGKGCIRVSVIMTDPTNGSTFSLLTSVLMRNWWPQD
jgi:prepilin-type N-terminal cleavage/methylation domain-containing protein